MNVNKASLFVKKGWLYDKCHGGQVNNIKAVFAFQKLLYCYIVTLLVLLCDGQAAGGED